MSLNSILFARRITSLALALMMLSLTGCNPQKYDDSEAQEVISQGTSIIQAWLDDHLPDAEVVSCEADIFGYPGGGPKYLNGYASGRFHVDGADVDYTVSTKTGQVYLDADMDLFADVAKDYILSALGLDEVQEMYQYSVVLELPYAYEGPGKASSSQDRVLTYGRLPADLALLIPETAPEEDSEPADPEAVPEDCIAALKEYIENPANRDLLSVVFDAAVSDDIDLKQYDLKRIRQIRDQYGIYFRLYTLKNHDELATGADWMADYDRHEWLPVPEWKLQLRALTDSFADSWDSKAPDGILREAHTYSVDNVAIDQTTDGYNISYKNERGPTFYLYAEEDSPLLAHDYTIKEDDPDAGKQGIEITTDVHWEYKESSGLWALCVDDGHAFFFSYPSILTIRE